MNSNQSLHPSHHPRLPRSRPTHHSRPTSMFDHNIRQMKLQRHYKIIKESCQNPDTKGYYLECHIFVLFGGVGNARRDDRVFINLSSDGRVHEAPVIQ